jgi:hypothetical protein
MSLQSFCFFTSLILIVVACCFFPDSEKWTNKLKKLPRSKTLSFISMSLGAIWFLYRHVLNLSEADFGDYKSIITLVSVFILVSSFYFTKDFLAVRGICILLLFYSREALDAAYLVESQSKLILVTLIYLLIIAALYFGSWPYRMRDFMDYIFTNKIRSRFLGALLLVNGLLLFQIGFLN